MTQQELRSKIKNPIFSRADISKLFAKELDTQINIQISRMVKRGNILRVKRGLFAFTNFVVDEFVFANKIYTPSYISLESVLFTAGVIPDIAVNITSVTTTTSKHFNLVLGSFTYSKIAGELFFGYKSMLDEQSGYFYNIASPEKALLDYIYIRRIRNLAESRLDMTNIDEEILDKYLIYYPKWVKEVLKNE